MVTRGFTPITSLALVPDDARLYVVDSIADEVTIVDLNKLQIERTVDSGRSGQL